MINVNSLLSYYRNNPNYEVKKVKGSDFNIEFRQSLVPRKNVLVELYPKTGRFYLNKGGKWRNISKLPEIQTDADVIAWVEKDSQSLFTNISSTNQHRLFDKVLFANFVAICSKLTSKTKGSSSILLNNERKDATLTN